MKKNKPVALIILDGFGYRKESTYNAIFKASTPHLDRWFAQFPHTLLNASAHAVGLLPQYLSNSEVGHSIIGSGRVFKQPVTLLHEAITDKTFFSHPVLLTQLQHLKNSGGRLHIMGLLSDAGAHSDSQQLYAYLSLAQQHGIKQTFIHSFLDGRDTPPQSADQYLSPLQSFLKTQNYGSLGSLHGRFYAMDRDNHWERTEQSYRVLTDPHPTPLRSWEEVIESNYQQGITDEFIPPVRLDPASHITPGDGIIFFNIRQDRARQLTATFVEESFNHFPTQNIPLTFFITPISYAAHLKTTVLYPQQPLSHTLKEALSNADRTLFTIAETEKYAHVTYFFDGYHEEPFKHETRMLIPSLPDKKYSAHPCMSAPQITQAVLHSLITHPCDFYLINYANADMVGHSGNFKETVKAVECLDAQLGLLYKAFVEDHNGTLIITADHGKAEAMYDSTHHQSHTAHTNNPVPFLVISQHTPTPSVAHLKELADIAPYILTLMNIPIPHEMKKGA